MVGLPLNNFKFMEGNEYILVTGASSGIGQRIAIELSKNYNIIINGRNQERIKQTLNECSKHKNHLCWQLDLENVNDIESSLDKFILDNNCSVIGFVHSAGFMKTIPLKMASVELFHNSFNINVISAAIISKVLTKRKINSNSLKSIVIISSNISNFGAKAFSAYAASKAAADGLMRCLAIELAPHVRVNSVLPGGIRTAMTEHMYQDPMLIERMEKTYPLGLGQQIDIYNAVNFLLGNDSRWITGQQLTVDGGRTINISA